MVFAAFLSYEFTGHRNMLFAAFLSWRISLTLCLLNFGVGSCHFTCSVQRGADTSHFAHGLCNILELQKLQRATCFCHQNAVLFIAFELNDQNPALLNPHRCLLGKCQAKQERDGESSGYWVTFWDSSELWEFPFPKMSWFHVTRKTFWTYQPCHLP